MVRLATVLLLIVSIVLSGCGTSQQAVNSPPPNTQPPDPFKVPPDDRSPLARWMEENEVAKKAGIGLLILGGVALVGLVVLTVGVVSIARQPGALG